MEAFGKFITGLILTIFLTIVGGFVLVKFWDWFIIPIFQFKSLTLIQAIGLSYFISYIKTTFKRNEDEFDFVKMISQMIFSLIMFVLLFGIGYIIHLFY